MILAIPAGHPLAKERKVALHDLREENLIFVSHGLAPRSFEETLSAACWKLGFAPRFVQAVSELMLAINLVAAGVGATFVPGYMNGVRTDAIVYLPVTSSASLVLDLSVLVHAERSAAAPVKNLERIVCQAFKPRG